MGNWASLALYVVVSSGIAWLAVLVWIRVLGQRPLTFILAVPILSPLVATPLTVASVGVSGFEPGFNTATIIAAAVVHVPLFWAAGRGLWATRGLGYRELAKARSK